MDIPRLRVRHKEERVGAEARWLLAKYAKHHDISPADVLERAIRDIARDFIPKGDIGKLPFRLWRQISVNAETGCWEWNAGTCLAWYGKSFIGRKTDGRKFSRMAHREVYTALVGPIPHGLVIDHLCRNRQCVNPAHLEPVTDRINIRRADGNWNKTHCKRGHEFTPENTLVVHNPKWGEQRKCRECARQYQREWWQNHRRPKRKRATSDCHNAPPSSTSEAV